MLKVVGFCSTSLGPSTQYTDNLSFVSQLYHSFSILKKSHFISIMLHIIYFCLHLLCHCLFSLNTGTKPDIKALTEVILSCITCFRPTIVMVSSTGSHTHWIHQHYGASLNCCLSRMSIIAYYLSLLDRLDARHANVFWGNSNCMDHAVAACLRKKNVCVIWYHLSLNISSYCKSYFYSGFS